MRISPLDIRQQQFTVKLLRGFDTQEVDAFLDDVAEDYETVLKEKAQLREQVATFEERARGLPATRSSAGRTRHSGCASRRRPSRARRTRPSRPCWPAPSASHRRQSV